MCGCVPSRVHRRATHHKHTDTHVTCEALLHLCMRMQITEQKSRVYSVYKSEACTFVSSAVHCPEEYSYTLERTRSQPSALLAREMEDKMYNSHISIVAEENTR
jgi:hypothetical protein